MLVMLVLLERDNLCADSVIFLTSYAVGFSNVVLQKEENTFVTRVGRSRKRVHAFFFCCTHPHPCIFTCSAWVGGALAHEGATRVEGILNQKSQVKAKTIM